MTKTCQTVAKNRSISEIARDCIKYGGGASVYAMPYLQAMTQLQVLSDKFGHDDAKQIVLSFLCNSGTWRGEYARLLKNELKSMLKTSPVKFED